MTEDFERREVDAPRRDEARLRVRQRPGGDRDGRDARHLPAGGPLRALRARRGLHGLDARALRRPRADRSTIPRARHMRARVHQPRVPRVRGERVEPGRRSWLRALAAHAHPLCGGKGVGAIGMCFTGNFALSMMLEPAMLAPVLSQPSLPCSDRRHAHRARRARGREGAPGARGPDRARLPLRGRPLLQGRALRRLREALGDRFVGRVLPDAVRVPEHADADPHSVVTLHLIDRAGEPTRAARRRDPRVLREAGAG